ncbi:MAG: hypothetical protein AB1656_04575 [Candidatus Omnitrophota bacterium]
MSGQSAGSAACLIYPSRDAEIAELFAAVVPMAAAGITSNGFGFDVDPLVNIPIWQFYSFQDNPWHIERVIEALQERSAHFRFTELIGIPHSNEYKSAFAAKELFEWLLQQQKPILYAFREISSSSLSQGDSKDVSLYLYVRHGENSNFRVEEQFPSEWNVKNIEVTNGTFVLESNGRIIWTGNNISEKAALSYTLEALETPSSDCALECVYSNETDFKDTLRSDLLFIPPKPLPFSEHRIVGMDERKSIAGQYGEDWAIVGTGKGISSNQDQFTFLYRKIEGDFRMVIHNARIEYNWKRFDNLNSSLHPWAKLGIMARQDITPDSAHAYALINFQNRALLLQSRGKKGDASSMDSLSNVKHASVNEHNKNIGLKRKGNAFTCFYPDSSGNDVDIDSIVIEMNDPIYVGVAATASGTSKNIDPMYSFPFIEPEENKAILGRFSDVHLTPIKEPSPISPWTFY